MIQPQKMDRKQLIAICVIFGMILFNATIAIGVMPVYVVRLGADPATTGLYLAFNFLCVTLGNIVGGWLTDHIGQRKRIILIGLFLWIPVPLLMTQAITITAVIFITGVMWLPGGMAIASLNSIIGLSAGEDERGRIFGWVALANGLGGVVAGAVSGQIVERWDFKGLFVVMAFMVVLSFIIAIFVRDVPMLPDKAHDNANVAPNIRTKISLMVYLLLIANLIGRLGISTSDLGRPLLMLNLGLDTTAVSNALAVSSAFILPLPLIMGWLSDRMGRKGLLTLCFGVGAAGVLILSRANLPWHFWLSAALAAIVNASTGVGQAYIADLTDAKMIGQSLSLFSSSNFIASMIGLGGAGYVMQGLGINPTLILGACLLGIGIILLMQIRPPIPKPIGDTVLPRKV